MSNGVSGLILVGVGGGGCRMAAAARRMYGEGMEVLVFDTDEVAIRALAGLRGHLFGATRLNRQGAGGVQADLVEHAAEVDHAADLGVGTAKTGNKGHARSQ